MRVRVLCNPDGTVSIVHPAPNSRKPEESQTEWLNRVFEKATPEGITYNDMDISSIPADRTFREAWEVNEDLVTVNMPKARSIHMDRIRALRNQKLSTLDFDYMLAFENNDETKMQDIAGLKKILRDIPQNFDLTVASTPEELKGMMPDILRT